MSTRPQLIIDRLSTPVAVVTLRQKPRWKRIIASPRFVWRLHFRTGLTWIAALRMARLVVQA